MFQYLINFIGEFKALISKRKEKILLDIPFFEQRKLVAGFQSSLHLGEETAEKWIDSACGMFCLKMILKKQLDKDYSVIDLADEMMKKYKGYTILPSGKLSSMYYEPFKKFIKDKFSLESEVCKILSINRIKYELSQGNFVIASVHWDIKDRMNTPVEKGGHLVVVTGYTDTSIFINNPSGYKDKSQVNYELSDREFEKFFAQRGIIIKN